MSEEKDPQQMPWQAGQQKHFSDARTQKGAYNYPGAPDEQPLPKLYLPGQQPVDATTYQDNTVALPAQEPGAPVGSGPTLLASQAVTIAGAAPNMPSTHYPTGGYPPPHSGVAPLQPTVPYAPGQAAPEGRKALALLVVLSVLVLIAIVVVLVLPLVLHPGTGQPPVAKGNPTSQPAPAATARPILTATAAPGIVPAGAPSQAIAGVSVSPATFNLQTDCQPDNGYRCTATLNASADTPDQTVWSDSLNQPDTGNIEPRNGTVSAGQQVQIIIRIHQQCPYDAIMDVTIQDQHLDIHFQC